MATEQEPNEQQPKSKGPTFWGAVIATIVLAALIGMLLIVVKHFQKAEEAASILGILVPAVVSLGAAALGAAVATNAVGGKATAEAGQAAAQASLQGVEEDKTQTAIAAQRLASETQSHVSALEQALRRIVEPVQEASTSPAGERDLLLEAPGATGSPVVIRSEDIGAAQASLAAVRSSLEDLQRNVQP
jgi:hypothetical protein